jgi:dCMP deaminase
MRASWDIYFMRIATEVATRSTCDRKHVGAVIVKDKMILATGYNGSVRTLPHCDDVGHLMEEGHCVRTVHAEANAIAQAARNGVRLDGSEIYVTASPCWGCFKLIANVGIWRIVFGEFYRDARIWEAAKALAIMLDGPEGNTPNVDPEKALIEGLYEIQSQVVHPMTSSAIAEWLFRAASYGQPGHAKTQKAIDELTAGHGGPAFIDYSAAVGYALRKVKHRPKDGKILRSEKRAGGLDGWRVVDVDSMPVEDTTLVEDKVATRGDLVDALLPILTTDQYRPLLAAYGLPASTSVAEIAEWADEKGLIEELLARCADISKKADKAV